MVKSEKGKFGTLPSLFGNNESHFDELWFTYPPRQQNQFVRTLVKLAPMTIVLVEEGIYPRESFTWRLDLTPVLKKVHNKVGVHNAQVG